MDDWALAKQPLTLQNTSIRWNGPGNYLQLKLFRKLECGFTFTVNCGMIDSVKNCFCSRSRLILLLIYSYHIL